MLVRKCSCGIPGRCDGCGRTFGITDSSRDRMCAISFGHRDMIFLCSECASKLVDKLCDFLGKTPIDPDSESYKVGYCNGYKEGFTDRRELDG